MKRRSSKELSIGKVKIGGSNKIAVQSMLNIPPENIKQNVLQAKELKNAGCDILRIAVSDNDALKTLSRIKEKVDIPLVADIHFDYKLAIESIKAGADKIRINPGNIGSEEKIEAVVKACFNKNIPIRIGVNSGSIEKDILKKYSHPTAEAMCESAMYNVRLLEKFGFNDIAISVKSSSVTQTIDAYRLVAKECDYPLHIGVTEAGTNGVGIVKSSIGIGSLLADGIGDTIRVSLTSNPVDEVIKGINILKDLDLNTEGVNFVSCPTCGRTKINLIKIANEAEQLLKNVKKNIKVAIMGCAVNGPGEAREADIGIAGADGYGVIFKKGKIIKKVSEENLLQELLEEIKSMN